MHYFEHNIKDYRADAFTLTMIQHGAYRQLIDQYYLNEKPLTLDLEVLCADLLVRGEDEKKAIVFILGKFFSKTEDGYVHKRCNTVIQAFKDKSDKNRNNAVKRWSKVKDANALPQECERNANQEPLTNNKEQLIEFVKPLDVNLEVWNNYMTLRRAQNKPITDANIKALRREAANAGLSLNAVITVCVENSWISFRADWVNRKKVEENKTKEVWGK
jgi:uncharacterized protein YdaU (DUF1376 family)